MTFYSCCHQRKHRCSALLALFAGKPPISGEFPLQICSGYIWRDHQLLAQSNLSIKSWRGEWSIKYAQWVTIYIMNQSISYIKVLSEQLRVRGIIGIFCFPLSPAVIGKSVLFTVCGGNPLVNSRFYPKTTSNAELWCILCCFSKKTVGHTVKMSVVWDEITLMSL